MKVVRNGMIFDVLQHNEGSGEIQVQGEFEFANKPYKRTLKMWWFIKDCEIMDRKNNKQVQQTSC